jgi:hypothetical protein
MCQGPLQFIGNTYDTLELLPPLSKPNNEIIEVEMPYATKLFEQEINTFLNMSMRVLSTRGLTRLRGTNNIIEGLSQESIELTELHLPDLIKVEEMATSAEKVVMAEDLMNAQQRLEDMKQKIRETEMAVQTIQETVQLTAQETGNILQVEQQAGEQQQQQTVQQDTAQELIVEPVQIEQPTIFVDDTVPIQPIDDNIKEINTAGQQSITTMEPVLTAPIENTVKQITNPQLIPATKRTLCVKKKPQQGEQMKPSIPANTSVQVVKLE